MYQYIHSSCSPNFVEDRYGNLSLFTTSYFKPHESICATYIWTEDNNCTKMESEAYDLEGNNMWFKQGKFPINLHGETEGEFMDGNGIKSNYFDGYWLFKTNLEQKGL